MEHKLRRCERSNSVWKEVFLRAFYTHIYTVDRTWRLHYIQSPWNPKISHVSNSIGLVCHIIWNTNAKVAATGLFACLFAFLALQRWRRSLGTCSGRKSGQYRPRVSVVLTMSVRMSVTVMCCMDFSLVTPCALVGNYRRFGRTYRLHLRATWRPRDWRQYVPPNRW